MIVFRGVQMGVRVQVIKNIYYLAITSNGHRHYESLHMRRSGTKMDREMDKVAEMCRAKREMQLVCANFEIPDPTGSKIPLYGYLKSLDAEETRKGYYSQYFRCIHYLEEYPEGTTIRLKDVTKEWLEKFQNYLLQKNLMPSSVKSYMLALRSAFNKAVKERKLVSNPASDLTLVKVSHSLKDILSLDDIKKLDSTPMGGKLGSEVRRAFLFACFTGLRISDLKELRWRNIEGDKLRIVMHKTQMALEIPIHENARKYLEQNNSDYVFSYLAQSRANCLAYLNTWVKSAGINKHIGWHTARRSFASIAVECGVDQYVISKLLGHTSIQHTSLYSQVPMPTKEQAIKKIPSI